eukprot:6178432-Pleurochrysis_carterae.AAC.1
MPHSEWSCQRTVISSTSTASTEAFERVPCYLQNEARHVGSAKSGTRLTRVAEAAKSNGCRCGSMQDLCAKMLTKACMHPSRLLYFVARFSRHSSEHMHEFQTSACVRKFFSGVPAGM